MKSRAIPVSAAILLMSAGAAHAQTFSESFNTIDTLPGSGWATINNSEPLGTANWFQGNVSFFAPQAGAGYIAANVNSTAAHGTISNWLITPARTLTNGDTFQFWTRTVSTPVFPDRLQVRLSSAGNSTNVGTTSTSVGDFSVVLLDINPTYTTGGYPSTWTQFTAVVSGLPAPTLGRFALRYFVEDGGALGSHSTYIGVDEALYTQGGVQFGACCLANGSCNLTTQTSCASQQGVYHGDNSTCATANCPQPGACCLPAGSCSQLTGSQCTAQSGVYSGDNTLCSATVCPQPGACCLPAGGCSVLNSTQCAAASGQYRGNGTTCATANCPTPGACCKTDGTCSQLFSQPCAAISGIYRGDNTLCANANCPQPATGACCLDQLGCNVMTQAQCLGQSGIYAGDNSVCATAGCPVNLVVNGGFETASFSGWTQFGDTTLTGITTGPIHGGTFGAYFGPPANGGIQQTLTAAAGTQVTLDFWYQAQGSTNFFKCELGGQTLATFTNDTTHAAWSNLVFNVTLAAANPVLKFTFSNATARSYLDGVKVTPATTACYPNCDASTAAPVLNVNDFTCFLNKFAAGDSYANCDGSTTPPVLNVLDFTCFLNRFGAGCS